MRSGEANRAPRPHNTHRRHPAPADINTWFSRNSEMNIEGCAQQVCHWRACGLPGLFQMLWVSFHSATAFRQAVDGLESSLGMELPLSLALLFEAVGGGGVFFYEKEVWLCVRFAGGSEDRSPFAMAWRPTLPSSFPQILLVEQVAKMSGGCGDGVVPFARDVDGTL